MKTKIEMLEILKTKRDEFDDFIIKLDREYFDGYPDAVVQVWMDEDGEFFETYNASPINLVSNDRRVLELGSFRPGWSSDWLDAEENNIIKEKYNDVDRSELTDKQIEEIHEEARENYKQWGEGYLLDFSDVVYRIESDVEFEIKLEKE